MRIKMGVIYVIENKLTNQMYVGQTANHDPINRFRGHKSAARVIRCMLI